MEITYIIGIDPGLQGCLWSISVAGSSGKWMDMPFTKNGINGKSILEFITHFPKDKTLVVLEKAFYSPLLKGKAGFQFGIYYALVKGIVMGLGYRLEEVRPVVWKRHYNLISSKTKIITKEDSIRKAIILNPIFRTKFVYNRVLTRRKGPGIGQKYSQTVKKDGRAEAYLMAEYGRRHFL